MVSTGPTVNPANYATCAVYAHSTLTRTWAQANAGNRDRNVARAGGLIGSFSWANATASYARGNVTCRGNGVKACGGLFGQSSNGNIVSSYATGNVVNEAFSPPQIDFIFDRCRNTYGYMLSGGLTGYHLAGDIRDSYSTGRVAAAMATPEPCTDGRWAARLVGGLGIRGGSGSIANSYWDVESSGIDYNDGGGAGHTTARLTNPTGYADIYANWNRDLDGGGSDDPWDFGTGAQYPILTWRHDVLSQRRQRAPQPRITQYELPPEPAPEYVAPPIVYNLNIRFNVKGLTLDEGESATYQVRMSQSPVGHPARVAITSNNPDVVVSPTEVTFSSANYREWQTVKVTTLRDANDTDESATLAHRGPNLSYGSILVMVNDIWPGTTTETVNGHTLTLHHAADAPAGVTITAPETLDTDAAVTVSAAPSHTPLSAPGYGLGAETAARMLASIRVNRAPSDGLTICLAVPAALVTEAGERPLTLLRYADGVWKPVAGAERRDGDDGVTLLCAAGVTEFGVFAAAYTLPALGAVSDLAATAGDAPGTVTLTWTPGANAAMHWVAGVKRSDLSDFAVWAAADAMGSHTVSGLEAGATYIFTVTAGRGEGDGRERSAWAAWATAIAAAPIPSPTPSTNPSPSPLSQ